MHTVAHILQSKRDQAVYTTEPNACVLDVVKTMAEKRVGSLLVLDAGKIVGIITERDYARKVTLQGRKAEETLVRDIMTSDVMYVHLHHTNEECMALMTENRLRHLPVLDDEGKLVGLVSIGDLVADIISEQQFTIQQLEHYIMGERG